MSLRNFGSHIKCLLHFDFPYFNERGDGLRNEIGNFAFTRKGNVKLVGSEAPADEIVEGTPKWGYRCLQSASNSDYIVATFSIYNILAGSMTEFSCWVRITTSQAGNILALVNSGTASFTLSVDASRQVCVSAPSILSSTAKGNKTLTLNTWHFVKVQISSDTLRIFIDDSVSRTAITQAKISFTELRIGGIAGQIDEFVFRDSLTEDIPTQPLRATLNVNNVGGYGSGSLGDVSINNSVVMNTSAYIVKSNSTGQCSLSGKTTGKYGDFAAGQECMILDTSTGEYSFTKITSVTSTYINFQNTKIAPTTANTVMCIQVPHFKTLTVKNGGKITAAQRQTSTAGGVITFRASGNVTLEGNGSILSSGLGIMRQDTKQVCNASLIDTFLFGEGGGIFLTCGGTLKCSSTSRIGASWSGAGKGGTPVNRADGNPGGSGYGGAGGSDIDTDNTGGNGGVGGGGGGNDGVGGSGTAYHGWDAGTNGSTGGGYFTSGNDQAWVTRPGGTQGLSINGTLGGGGGAGGSGTSKEGYHTPCGASVVIIAQTVNIPEEVISTGGAGGLKNNGDTQSGGGGTGFCYIACEKGA